MPNHSIVTTVERTSDFLVKNHVLWAPMGFLDAGYPQVSGADQVIVPITSNLRVPIRYKNLSRILALTPPLSAPLEYTSIGRTQRSDVEIATPPRYYTLFSVQQWESIIEAVWPL